MNAHKLHLLSSATSIVVRAFHHRNLKSKSLSQLFLAEFHCVGFHVRGPILSFV